MIANTNKFHLCPPTAKGKIMIEALYGVEFWSNQSSMGYGVAVLETGRIFGGDTSFTYLGSYEIQNGVLSATVRCNNDRMVLPSVFPWYRSLHPSHIRWN